MGLGHPTIKWADAKVAHRFAGGPPPVKPPKYGTARAVHEWKVAGRWILAAVVAMVLLQAAVWYAGDGQAESLHAWQQRMLWVIGINVIIAGSYTLFPKRQRGPALPGRGGVCASVRRRGPTGHLRRPCWLSAPG